MNKLVFLDLEGPISPQDNAYELVSSVENGGRIFETISKYDDIMSLRRGYEPGRTLALIVPFLVFHGIREKDIKRISENAKIVEGASQLINKLRSEGWIVHILSTSYEQHALNVGTKVGISKEHISCTELNLGEVDMPKSALRLVEEAEKDIILGRDNEEIVSRLDTFFRELYDAGCGSIDRMKVMGGARKAEEMLKIAERNKIGLRNAIAVGDGITDFKMLERCRKEGGIAVAFNGNEYAIPYADVGLASLDLRFLYVVTSTFASEGKEGALNTVRDWESLCEPDNFNFPHFHCLEDVSEEELEEVITIHKVYREKVRGDAAKLG